MRRNLLRSGAVLAAGALAVGLAGCGVGNKGGDAELSDEPVTIRMYWWGGDARHERTQQVIDLFEETYPNITVEPEFADWSGYWEKLATATAGKNSPDVIQMDAQYLAEYADRGALLDLSTLDVDLSGMEDSVRGTGQIDGAQYGAPYSTSNMAVVVNTDLLDEIGVALPENTDAWTWSDYDAWAAEVSAAAPDGVFGAQASADIVELQLFARQKGEELYEDGEVVVSPETVADYFQLSLDRMASGAAAPASVFAENAGLPLDQLPISTGKSVTQVVYATQVSAYAAASGANLQLLRLPNVDGGIATWNFFKPGMYWSASSQSEHPAEAALLIDFIMNDPEAAKIIGAERGFPAVASSLEAIRPDLSETDIQAVDFTDTEIPTLGDAPQVAPAGSSDAAATLLRYAQEVFFDRQTPEEAAQAFIDEVQASIDAAG